MNPKVDDYIDKSEKWQSAFEKLRAILLDCNLNETLKWGTPCYEYRDTNLALIHGFKDYCALLFFKGALLSDPESVLIQQSKNVQAQRQIRFTSAKQVAQMEAVIKSYIYEAIEVEKAGLQVTFKKTGEFEMAEEFAARLKKNKALKTAFEALTPGRQRGYLLHFSSAKQSKTRESRIEKSIPQILKGKGLDD
ncbi:hypothetical protein HHL16_12420 [Pseudoflavitalea sp. G-6-1-2]|uniref:YdeI/OmpD-associated family protein n=1 Tax=Pseudoflavitalea sp. G-6-1-2 TaxID=2728841 RepID=UPI00146F6090|nr:DUF1801 domain-containing protein [Pseudoflavitalea sp. G-6-1-2]NML21687.1 hypothetical protein [Pseudoflavitalea sp. G-6-1-2]